MDQRRHRRTFLNNLHGIPTDTPIYEKNGWTADAHLVTEAALHHFDLRLSMLKWLDDHVDAQDEHGMVPQIVPTPGWGLGPDPAWSASMVLIPWDLYWEYGEKEILRRYADPVLAYARRVLELCDGGVWPHHSWGDWLAPGHMFAPEGPAPTATMMVYRIATRAARILRAIGRDREASEMEDKAVSVAQAYHDAYFDAVTGSYQVDGAGYRQTMNILPLAFGAVPADHVDAVFRSLVQDLEMRTSGHLDCGAAAVKHLPHVLSDHGRPDLAVTVLAQPTRPGWGVWMQRALRRCGSRGTSTRGPTTTTSWLCLQLGPAACVRCSSDEPALVHVRGGPGRGSASHVVDVRAQDRPRLGAGPLVSRR